MDVLEIPSPETVNFLTQTLRGRAETLALFELPVAELEGIAGLRDPWEAALALISLSGLRNLLGVIRSHRDHILRLKIDVMVSRLDKLESSLSSIIGAQDTALVIALMDL